MRFSRFRPRVLNACTRTGLIRTYAHFRFHLLLFFCGGCTTCFSYNICVYHFCFVCVFPLVLFRSRLTGACPVTTDLIMRVKCESHDVALFTTFFAVRYSRCLSTRRCNACSTVPLLSIRIPLVCFLFRRGLVLSLESDWSLSCDHGLNCASYCVNNIVGLCVCICLCVSICRCT